METFHFTLKSSNRKTGPIPTTMTSRNSCPISCPLRGAGCYAESGPLSLAWRKHTRASFDELLAFVQSLPPGQIWRHNVAGDLPGNGDRIDARKLAKLARANVGKRGFTYTHKPPTSANHDAIAKANRVGFVVNLSADSLDESDQFLSLQVAPVVVTLPSGQTVNCTTPAGNRVVVCPATQRNGVNCASCRLCARGDRRIIVGFPAHGIKAMAVSERLQSA